VAEALPASCRALLWCQTEKGSESSEEQIEISSTISWENQKSFEV
jgi:hypothetical protein